MNKFKLILIFSIIVLLSCTKNDKYIFKYYANGNIKYKLIYHNGNKEDYTEIKYKKSGGIIYKQDFVNGKRNGAMLFYKNHNLIMIKNYKADSLHGIIKYYSQSNPNNLEVKYFAINGKYISGRKYSYNKDSTLFQMVSHLFYKKDTIYEEGHLYWDLDNNIIPSNSNYYRVVAKDTIRLGERYKMSVNFISAYECDLKLELGEMDKSLEFVNPPKLYKGHKSIIVKLSPEKVGNNLIMGKLYSSRDTLIDGKIKQYVKEYIFYHDFYVSETAVNN